MLVGSSADVFCKMAYYLFFLATTNASGNLVALAVDRALVVSHTTWHHKVNWNTMVPLISLVIAVFHSILLIPALVFYEFHDGMCQMKSGNQLLAQVYEGVMVAIFSVGSHFLAVCAASFVFGKKLREGCQNRNKGKDEENQRVVSESRNSGSNHNHMAICPQSQPICPQNV